MIAARRRDHAARALRRLERGHERDRVARLERVRRQVVLVLHQHADAVADRLVELRDSGAAASAAGAARCGARAATTSSQVIGQLTRESSATPCAVAIGAQCRVEVFFLMMGLWLVVAVALGMRRPRGLGGAALRARLDAVYGEPHELVQRDRRRRSPRRISSSTTARSRELEGQGLSLARRRRGPDAVADLSAEPHVPAAVRRRGRDDPRERVSPASARRRGLAAPARAAVPAPPARDRARQRGRRARSSSRATRTASIGSSRRPRRRSSGCRCTTPMLEVVARHEARHHRAAARASRARAGRASRRSRTCSRRWRARTSRWRAIARRSAACRATSSSA